MKTFTALACLVSLVLGAPPAARAATVTYDFLVSGNAGSGSGRFQFDDASASVGPFGETEYALTSFRFVFGGVTFNLADLDGKAGLALFDGVDFLGLEAARTLPGPVSFSLLPSVGGEDAFLATARATSSITFRLDPNGVPEPGTLGLGLAAFAAAAALHRRRPTHGGLRATR